MKETHNILLHLVQSLKNVRGFDSDEFIRTHQQGEQLVSVRLNPKKKIEPLPKWEPIPWTKNGFYLPERISFTLDPLFHAGCYYVQEASSMFLEKGLECHAAHNQFIKVLDLCAAPGGKSTLLASFLKEGDLLVSNEVIKSRVLPLVDNINKWGSANVLVSNNDPKDFQRLGAFFDIILVDAPCSGSGMFRKDLETMREWSVENVNMCAKRQERILEDILPCLKSNGVLIYATCSYSKEENEDMLDFLMDNYALETLDISLEEDWGIEKTFSDKHQAVGFRFYPYKVEGEGFFISFLRKITDDERSEPSKRKTVSRSLDKNIQKTLGEYVEKDIEWDFLKINEEYMAISSSLMSDVNFLQQHLYLKKLGIGMGQLMREDLIPDHSLALCNYLSNKVVFIALDRDQSLAYLRKQPFVMDSNLKGWVCFTYQGFALGWAKLLNNRINNYFPKELRILK